MAAARRGLVHSRVIPIKVDDESRNKPDSPAIWPPDRSRAAPSEAVGKAGWTGASGPTINRPLRAVSPRSAQVAQLVEHATENRSVGGSIPPLGTIFCRGGFASESQAALHGDRHRGGAKRSKLTPRSSHPLDCDSIDWEFHLNAASAWNDRCRYRDRVRRDLKLR
jgi:hypothetical protein